MVLHDYALYKSTFTLLYFTLLYFTLLYFSRTKSKSEDWLQGFLCRRGPCLESAADQLETLAFDGFIQEQTEEFSVSCCLQGLVLGPILFLLYTADLLQLVKRHN